MRRKFDYLAEQGLTFAELSEDIKVEVSVLGGLDIFTDAHVQGVANITNTICMQMEMPYNKLRFCMLCAYLHDVGKILIPSEILQKKESLTAEEYEIMKEHPKYSYDICIKHEEFKDIAPIVRAHHESFDGSGYPDGLKGDEIPFEAAIIKVADVYDALTRKRQYKEGFIKSDAVKILMEDASRKKLSASILLYLVNSIIEELTYAEKEQEDIIKSNRDDLEILNELDEIYKQIYDSGDIARFAKKLNRYDLPSGYDMRSNANLLLNKQKIVENEEKLLFSIKDELKTIKVQYKEIQKLADDEEWYK